MGKQQVTGFQYLHWMNKNTYSSGDLGTDFVTFDDHKKLARSFKCCFQQKKKKKIYYYQKLFIFEGRKKILLKAFNLFLVYFN